ncbi:MAG: 30S ribosomal protein S9 [bacterium]|nr:30S ribosomal protein S9 [bacterium]
MGKPEKYYEAVGRRKSAVARVRLFTRGSEIVINGRPYQDYFKTEELRQVMEAPFRKMKNLGKFRTEIKVKGGGLHGQVEAARHGISRALVKFNADFRKRLKRVGFLTRDARVKERKKYGLKGARRAPQWSKR